MTITSQSLRVSELEIFLFFDISSPRIETEVIPHDFLERLRFAISAINLVAELEPSISRC